MKILHVFCSSITYGEIRVSTSQERTSAKDVHHPLTSRPTPVLVEVSIAKVWTFSQYTADFGWSIQLCSLAPGIARDLIQGSCKKEIYAILLK